MTIVVTGSAGQLGGELCRRLGAAAVGIDLPELDLTQPAAVEAWLRRVRPRCVINTAAYTQVDRAEENRELCFAINAAAVETLARVCGELDCLLVQISTDYVFTAAPPRAAPFLETDPIAPDGVYARSKAQGEEAARRCPRHLVVRTCGLYAPMAGEPVRGRNFVETMLYLARDRKELRIVHDQYCTPSYVPHVARGIRELIERRRTGTFHVVNSGSTNWIGFAVEVFRMAGIAMKLVPITTEEYAAAAPRPRYSVLSTAAYAATGAEPLPPWVQGLREFFDAARRAQTA